MTIIVNDSPSAHAQASDVIRKGGVISFRTDTFYGLGVDPFDQEAVQKIKALKGRDDGKPILVIISDSTEADRFIAERSGVFEIVRGRHWPGALTIVMNALPGVPDDLTAGTGTIGLRLPDDALVRDLVRACGGALTATSANPADEAPARNAREVENYFSSGVDLIIDGGETTSNLPSTVLDISGDTPKIIRVGRVRSEQIERTLSIASEGTSRIMKTGAPTE